MLAKYNNGDIARELITVTFPLRDRYLHFQPDKRFFIDFSCDQAALKNTSVCPSVCPSVCDTFFIMFIS